MEVDHWPHWLLLCGQKKGEKKDIFKIPSKKNKSQQYFISDILGSHPWPHLTCLFHHLTCVLPLFCILHAPYLHSEALVHPIPVLNLKPPYAHYSILDLNINREPAETFHLIWQWPSYVDWRQVVWGELTHTCISRPDQFCHI